MGKEHQTVSTGLLVPRIQAAIVIEALPEKTPRKAPLYWWLAGLLVSIIILREEAVANPVICAAIICAFGSGWYGASTTNTNR
tara:strand:+ start:728 stop:976 length:249 start_codon:yes stop_codon:yes gene_type:complete